MHERQGRRFDGAGPTEMLSDKMLDEFGEVKYGVTVVQEVHHVNEGSCKAFIAIRRSACLWRVYERIADKC